MVTVNTDSYVSEAELTSYALDRGITITGDISILLIKAMDVLEANSFKGYLVADTQPLKFPRYGISSHDDYIVPNNIKKSQLMLAISIGQGNDFGELNDLESFSSVQLGAIKIDTKNLDKKSLPPLVVELLKPYIGATTRLVRA